jgi:hypothetical protein
MLKMVAAKTDWGGELFALAPATPSASYSTTTPRVAMPSVFITCST